jgi:hypothetical protein
MSVGKCEHGRQQQPVDDLDAALARFEELCAPRAT